MITQNRFIFVLAGLLAACAPDPASSVSFSGFTPEQLELAYNALDQWCEAVDWCPVVTLDGELHVTLQDAELYAQHDRRARSGGFNDGGTRDPFNPAGGQSYINRDRLEAYAPAQQWIGIAHELGHEGIVGGEHTRYGLMAPSPKAAPCIDQWAVRAWCRAVGCPQDAASTCPQELESAMVAAIDGGD